MFFSISQVMARYALDQSRSERQAKSFVVSDVNDFGPHPNEKRIWTSMSRRARFGMSAHISASRSSLKIMV